MLTLLALLQKFKLKHFHPIIRAVGAARWQPDWMTNL